MSARVDLLRNKDEVWLELSCETAFLPIGRGDGVCLEQNQPPIGTLMLGTKDLLHCLRAACKQG
jgi:hypothetical protein